jgi:hypothetical protein
MEKAIFGMYTTPKRNRTWILRPEEIDAEVKRVIQSGELATSRREDGNTV